MQQRMHVRVDVHTSAYLPRCVSKCDVCMRMRMNMETHILDMGILTTSSPTIISKEPLNFNPLAIYVLNNIGFFSDYSW